MQDRPVITILNRVVRAIIATPSFHAEKKASLVKVLRKELPAGVLVGVEESSLQQRPFGWSQSTLNLDVR